MLYLVIAGIIFVVFGMCAFVVSVLIHRAPLREDIPDEETKEAPSRDWGLQYQVQREYGKINYKSSPLFTRIHS